jgi:transcriptional regulator with XRE-family HTH domain
MGSAISGSSLCRRFDVALGERIRAVRRKTGQSLSKLAPQLGVSAATLSGIERGSRTIEPAELVDLARVLAPTGDPVKTAASWLPDPLKV